MEEATAAVFSEETPVAPVPVPLAAPVSGKERLQSLDVLRGFALLGILIMNIVAFGLPFSTYTNPTVFGDFTGLSRGIWAFGHIFADQKFMSMFSILFGAGIALMTDREEHRGGHPWALHGRRMLWLALIGSLHAYLLWFGDILFTYAVTGLWVFLFRHRQPRTLAILGLLALSLPTLLGLGLATGFQHFPPEQQKPMIEQWQPTAQQIQEDLTIYRGGWWQQMEKRVPTAAMLQSSALLFFVMWKAGGLMLIGMALFRWGILSGKASSAVYGRLVAGGLGLGMPLILYGLKRHFEEGFSFEYSMLWGGFANYWGSLGVCLAYIGILCLVLRRGWLQGLTDRLAAVGRMAFTNYLLQTVLCTLIFYGHGLGLYGKLDRLALLGVVFVVWAVELWLSPLWLSAYRFGPAEWLWRSLTYGRLQPMARS